jgi:signal recognition particle receptor subunit beta
MHFFLNVFKRFIADTKVVIGVTQMDMKAKPCIKEYQNQFDNSMVKPAVFCIDARVKHDISKLVQALFSHEPK